MKTIYLDNAATTPLRQEVIEAMTNELSTNYGNASSSHSFGRHSKNAIETSRKTIAKLLNCTASEIIFTANATEATNWILRSAIQDLKIERIITSKIEHHATLHTVSHLQKEFNIEVEFVSILKSGEIDLKHLEELLQNSKKTIVSLMHVNNEIGSVLDIEKASQLCKSNNALFHCDTVQSIGKTEIDLQKNPIDFLVASAHKFHGPKGVGFAFVRKGILLQPMIFGGEQEKGLRAGTEATHQVVGMAKALELGISNLVEERKYIIELNKYCIEKLHSNFENIKLNCKSSLYNILNVCLPFSEEKTAMLLFNLDMKGIAVSRGSACQSGSLKPSHVLAEFLSDEDLKKPSLRISFSHYNTKEEIDSFVEVLKSV